MSFLNELLDLKGKEIMIFDLDDKVDDVYDKYFQPYEFDNSGRTYKYRNHLIRINYLFNENKSINMLDTVKITGIEAIC